MQPDAVTTQRFGSHLSVAGGFETAFDQAVKVGCDCLQIFVKNQKQWSAKPLTDEAIRGYKRCLKATGVRPVVAHASYLINLGSPQPDLWQRSIAAVVDELERCEALGIRGLVLHPGAHMGEGIEAGIARIVAGLDEIHHRAPGVKAKVLLETTAGQGSSIGCRIEDLGAIMDRVSDAGRLGVCLDTCHLFAAGYDLRKADEYDRTVDLLRRNVGLSRIKCIHLNDSKGVCGSRIDRHEHVGCGKIGLAGFRNVILDPRLAKVPRILETPKGLNERGVEHDVVNLRKLRKIVGGIARASQPCG